MVYCEFQVQSELTIRHKHRLVPYYESWLLGHGKSVNTEVYYCEYLYFCGVSYREFWLYTYTFIYKLAPLLYMYASVGKARGRQCQGWIPSCVREKSREMASRLERERGAGLLRLGIVGEVLRFLLLLLLHRRRRQTDKSSWMRSNWWLRNSGDPRRKGAEEEMRYGFLSLSF